MREHTATPDSPLWRISLFNKLLICAALSVWALNLVPPIWVVSSRHFFLSKLHIPPGLLAFTAKKAEATIRMQNASRAQSYGVALESYAYYHGGQLPTDLDVLVPEYLSVDQAQPYCDVQTGALHRWTYFPGYTRSSPGSPILLASPVTDSPGRVIYNFDHKVGIVPEKKYQQLLQQQPPREW